MEFLEDENYVLKDGAIGWLFNNDMATAVIKQPEAVKNVLKDYVLTGGAQLIGCPTFAFTPTLMQKKFGRNFDPGMVKGFNQAGAGILKKAIDELEVEHPNREVYTAGAVGPEGTNVEHIASRTDAFLKGLGTEEAICRYIQRYEAIDAVLTPDIWLAETIPTAEEGVAAVTALRRCNYKPIAISFQFQYGDRTHFQLTRDIVRTMKALDIDMLGINCVSVESTLKATKLIRKLGYDRPLMLYANAGNPPNYTPAEEMAQRYICQAVKANGDYPLIFGGCCGTDPNYIKTFGEYFRSCL